MSASVPGRRSRVAFRICAAALTAALTACGSLGFFVANAPVPFGSFKRSTDLPYGEDARQRLDVFSPRTGKHPVVVFFYGGSWTMGQKSQYAFVGAALAARGYVTVIPDYRLYPQVRFPELIADGARAVAWVRQHAPEFGGDPDRIVLMGHSAGAHMAALLVLNDEYLVKADVPPHSIVGLIGLSGPYALVPNSETLRAIFTSPYTPEDWQPVRFASSRAPPTLLLQGLDDTVVSSTHTQKMRDALQSHGIPVESYFYPKRGHSDTIASFSLAARFRTPTLNATLTFLRRVTADDDSDRVDYR
jgi:acetyl esterase/lipase